MILCGAFLVSECVHSTFLVGKNLCGTLLVSEGFGNTLFISENLCSMFLVSKGFGNMLLVGENLRSMFLVGVTILFLSSSYVSSFLCLSHSYLPWYVSLLLDSLLVPPEPTELLFNPSMTMSHAVPLSTTGRDRIAYLPISYLLIFWTASSLTDSLVSVTCPLLSIVPPDSIAFLNHVSYSTHSTLSAPVIVLLIYTI